MIYSRRINESKQNLGASYNIKSKARELRKSTTEAEEILWKHLRKTIKRNAFPKTTSI